ncbi:MAG: YciI family protein [Blastocatellia bacterium]
MEKYQFGLLKRGPKWTAESTAETQKIQEGHMANINKMAKLGKLVAAGPMADNSDVAGIFIFKAASLDEARALASEDPAIKAGRLVLELQDWWGQQRIGAQLQEEAQAGREPKYTMTKYYLALLGKGAQAAGNSSAEQKLQLDHLWYLRRQLDAKTYVAAGPFAGAGDWLGVCVIAANSPEEAKAIVDADPRVKAGSLRVALHTWWVAKEVWP